ncbi:hypothetical protein ASE00_20195 [Sphingomonas sp. Root710]|uniref:glycosyl transferase family 90 n=1 Tax=Sphingomonas sp. Root710 TaxID=1736594 RepID=UPI0006F7073F|nr:glycosyl transferase family 90 [Sphingomonas sp. Root710]KRB79428.1 hypothetical protein ASE00_20195 [Sphingomonas sp. Root710]
MDEWASLEIAPWRGTGLRRDTLLAGLNEAAARDPSIRIFHIRDGHVAIDEPLTAAPSPALADLIASRAPLYRDFIQAVVAEHGIDCQVPLAIRLGDRGPEERDVPLFCFHKIRFERTILLPDLDFIISAYYAGAAFQDGRSFADKAPEACFIGATTGGIVSMKRVEADAHERIRAARFFRDEPDVRFEISAVVQCDSDETRRIVETMVPMAAGWRDWHDQFGYRYILSMDGNGATWSRTAVALASNSVLVKYASASLLYYMHGLEPWVHFLPVRRDADVLDIVAHADRTFERDAAIAAAGRAFAARHFSREAVTGYMAALLRGYAGAVAPR